jgi:hypothetical protein
VTRDLDLLVNSAVIAVPETYHVVDAASHDQILVCNVDARYVPFVTTVDLLAGDELVTLLGLR